MNNKGFMMAEVVVVASIVLVTMAGLYVSYNKVFSLYNQRIDYYDVTTLYELSNIKENTNLYGVQNFYSNGNVVSGAYTIIQEEFRKVFWVDVHLLDTLDVGSPKFNDYLRYLYNSVEFEMRDVYVMEDCINNDPDNCKYAYLEGKREDNRFE